MITVNKIELGRFMLHEHSTLALPETGIVLVTGENGSGKSAIVEGVSWGLWGSTLRGEPPWQDGKGCFARVDANGHAIVRKRLKAKSSVRVIDGATELEYQTATKAQSYIDQTIGEHALWLRTCVFSTTSDESKFTSATDSARKRLLERILDLGKFDDALTRCRDELRTAKADAVASQASRKLAETKLAAAEQRACDAAAYSATLGEAPDTAKRAAFVAAVAKADSDRKTANAELKACYEQRARAQAMTARRDVLDGSCPTCGQEHPESERERVRAELARLASEAAQLDDRERAANEAYGAANVAESEATAAVAAIDSAVATYKRETAQREAAQRAAVEAERDRQCAAETIADLDAGAVATEHDIAVLEQCERVLGLKGVRAQILARALTAIELSANAWLARLGGPGYEIELRPYTEKKTKGTSDAIGLRVRHPRRQEWHAFASTSQGQQRRFDVALVFALADFARASLDVEAGTLFVDEAFDALDTEGVTRVVDALRELSSDRCVVVITHNESFQSLLNPTTHVRVCDGVLT